MKPLFEISNDYLKLLQEIELADELTDEHLDLFKNVESDFNDKAINIGFIIKTIEAEYNAVHDNIQKQEKRLSSVYKKMEGLKEYVRSEMERTGLKEAKNSEIALKIKVNPPFVVVQDENSIPYQYFIEQVVRKIDKTMISRDLKNNIVVPGAFLQQKKRIEII